MAIDTPLASNLQGKKVGRWNVIKKRIKAEDDNSGAFSSCYEVCDDEGNNGFLKAFNILYAFEAIGKSMDRLKHISERFTYERDLLDFCRERRMKRVVTAIDHGEYQEGGEIPVPYLVFEVASGSLKIINFLHNPNLVWKLRAFHGALVGVSQLHQGRIAHQDIKPSNILIFGTTYSKISDLGSATQFGNILEWDTPDEMNTDLRYAPIELLYGYFSQDWETRRFGADLFMLGGLLSYMVSGTNVLSRVLKRIPQEQHWHRFQGSFREILPNIMMAFHDILREIEDTIPSPIRNELIEVIRQLSYPKPEDRGNTPKFRGRIGQFNLRRYISIIDRLADKSEIYKL